MLSAGFFLFLTFLASQDPVDASLRPSQFNTDDQAAPLGKLSSVRKYVVSEFYKLLMHTLPEILTFVLSAYHAKRRTQCR